MADTRRKLETQGNPGRSGSDSLTARIIEAQDDERRKISRELHDSVGQSLVAVKMSIGKFQRTARIRLAAHRRGVPINEFVLRSVFRAYEMRLQTEKDLIKGKRKVAH